MWWAEEAHVQVSIACQSVIDRSEAQFGSLKLLARSRRCHGVKNRHQLQDHTVCNLATL